MIFPLAFRGAPRAALLLACLAAAPCARAQPAAPPPASSAPAQPGGNDAGDQPPPAKPAYTPAPAPPVPSWQPRQAAQLQVLDKVNGQSGTLIIAAGQTGTYRGISISVKSCFARPPDQPPDATTFVVIQDAASPGASTAAATPPAPLFTGWLLAAEPAASMLEHPVYDVRVLGCR